MTPPPSELDALIRAARGVPGPPPDVAARLIERLDAVPTPGPATGASAAGAGLSKTALLLGAGGLLLAGALAGGAAVWAVRGSAPAPAPIQIVIAAATPSAEAPAVAPASEPPPVEPIEPKPPAVVRPAPRPSPSAGRTEQSTLEEERKLLEGARAAVVAGAWGDALKAVGLHAARFPDGALAEEREALAIQALASTDRASAVSRIAAFRARWPSSIFEPLIEKIVPRDGSTGSPQ